MNKSKLIKKKGRIILEYRSGKGQQLMERELYEINRGAISGLMRIGVVKKGSSIILRYDLTGYPTLREYLQTPLTRERFTQLLQSILCTLQEMKAEVCSIGCLVMNAETILVNPANRNVLFVFIPFSSFENETSLQSMLLSIVKYAVFSADEDTKYVREYIAILNRGINFSPFELEQFVNRLSGHTQAKEAVECPQCHQEMEAEACYCTNCGCKLAGRSEALRKITYDPQTAQQPAGQQQPTGGTDSIGSAPAGDPTTVLTDNPGGGTTVLGYDEEPKVSYPYLIRERTDEKISINKPSFRLGKEKQYCDYFVSDNSAISRSHADIIERNGRYFVMDRNSTNHTYVDGRVIRPEQEVELFDGTVLRLANENFTYYQ